MLTDDYIQDNELSDLSVVYFTGAWVEGMNRTIQLGILTIKLVFSF